MLSMKYGIAALVGALAVVGLSASAQATYRGCGFDRYGYHPPDFSGCGPAVAIVAVPAPVVRVKRVRRSRPPVRRVQRTVKRPVQRRPRVRRVVAMMPPPPPPPPPFDGYYVAKPIQPGCYFDNGYDMRVHRICYSGW
jgi:hypothetical protein